MIEVLKFQAAKDSLNEKYCKLKIASNSEKNEFF